MRDVRPLTALALAWLGVFMLGGCAPGGRVGESPPALFSPPSDTFSVSGRLAARHAGQGLSAHFRWQHHGRRDTVELASPLGETLARMSGEAGKVELERANGSRESASTWTELTTRGLGWPLPVEGLAWWIQGAPDPRYAFVWETGTDPRVLRQNGWTIVFSAASASEQPLRPRRITLIYPDIEVRLAIDAWE